jgi:hypothetical protein
MKKRVKTYIVTVQVHSLEVYEVEAETPDEAMDLWQDGELLREDFSKLEAEPLSAVEKRERL